MEKGEKVDTGAIRNLFLPSAQLTILNHADSFFSESAALDDFIALLSGPYYEQVFFEEKINKFVDQHNGIAQVFQN